MGSPHPAWCVLRVVVARDAEEAVSSFLWEAGTNGIIFTDVTASTLLLEASFEENPDLLSIRRQLETTLSRWGLPEQSLVSIDQQSLLEVDWLQEWKKGYHALTVGESFLISPSWETPEATGDRIVIRIDPGMAFGTGTHESTRLCLRAIEQYWEGETLLDVGTGTGILSMAAAKMLPGARIVAIDNDPVAIDVALENLTRNHANTVIQLVNGPVQCLHGIAFDMIVANLTLDLIERNIESIVRLMRPDGSLALSGILTEQEETLISFLGTFGLSVVTHLVEGEWVALVCFLS